MLASIIRRIYHHTLQTFWSTRITYHFVTHTNSLLSHARVHASLNHPLHKSRKQLSSQLSRPRSLLAQKKCSFFFIHPPLYGPLKVGKASFYKKKSDEEKCPVFLRQNKNSWACAGEEKNTGLRKSCQGSVRRHILEKIFHKWDIFAWWRRKRNFSTKKHGSSKTICWNVLRAEEVEKKEIKVRGWGELRGFWAGEGLKGNWRVIEEISFPLSI